MLRRVFDMGCAAAGVVLLSPLFFLIAIAIKLDDQGPVIYAQPRIGKGFRVFRLYKFRSMIPEADRTGLLTAPNDARLTRVGWFLRRHKLDELLQLINVLIGDMQLVGPRPEVGRYVEMFRSQYEQLLQDRPGITDPATLAYRREEEILLAERLEEQYVSQVLPEKLRLSLDYQRRRNFMTDLGMLFKTAAGLGNSPTDTGGA
jgi:lipopolysaccharide/colanic/teichoic acid biosynthesis glycosyltransferase